jgi:maltose O-acetyltransferase
MQVNRDSLLYRMARLVLREYAPPKLLGLARGAAKARLSRADSFGKGTVIRGKVCFHFRGVVVVGDYLEADGHASGVCIKVFKEGKLTLGDYVRMNVGVWIEVASETRIGSHVMMAPYVSIVDDSRHDIEPGAPRYRRPVIIGDNVWLGQKVSVMPGVTIGEGSVIGANSVVSRDIPPNVFAAGAPARVIRQLEIPDGWNRVDASNREYARRSS